MPDLPSNGAVNGRRRFHRRDLALVAIGVYLSSAAVHVWDANRDAGHALPTPDGRTLRVAAGRTIRSEAARNTAIHERALAETDDPELRAAIRRELDEIPGKLEQDLAKSAALGRLRGAVAVHGPLMAVGVAACVLICCVSAFDSANLERGSFLLAALIGLSAAAVALYQMQALGFVREFVD